MSQAKKVALLLGVFFFGCAAERVMVVVPPARADTPSQRWQYSCRDASQDEITRVANTYGAQGWELAVGLGGSGTSFWCFKRQLP